MSTYKLSSLGAVWMVIKPLFTFGIYLVVFGVIFKVRWSTSEPDSLGLSFVLPLLTGVAIHEYYASMMTQASSILSENRNYIKKVAFPLELLPLALTAKNLLTLAIYLIIIAAAVIGIRGTNVDSEVILLLPLLFVIVLSGTGIALICSTLGLFFPDFKHVNEVLAQVLFFITPIFYPLQQVPPSLRPIICLNPLTLIVEATRDVLLWGKAPNLDSALMLLFLSWLAVSLGYLVFQRCRRGFADVI